MMRVSEIALREGMRAFGAKAEAGRDLGTPDGRQDGAAHANTETVYAIAIST